MHLLMHRYSPWQGAIRCSTNIYASLFLEAGHQVSYQQAMVHAGHALKRSDNFRSFLRGPRWDRGAYVYTPISVVPYMQKRGLFNTPTADAAYRTCVPPIRRTVERSGLGAPDVVWSAPLGGSGLVRLFPEAKLVCQVVDYYPAFSRLPTNALERTDYERASHVLLIGHAMRSHVVQVLGIPEHKVTVLGQGVFREAYSDDLEAPDDLRDLPHPRAVWVGWNEKLDEGLLHAAAAAIERAGGSVVLIGPSAAKTRRVREAFSCVHELGPRSPEQVPAYLTHCDIGLMLYERASMDIYRGQNPLKLYEYAAAGLAILSTPHDEYAFIEPPVHVVADEASVADAVRQVVRGPGANRAAVKAWVADYDWRARARRALEVIA